MALDMKECREALEAARKQYEIDEAQRKVDDEQRRRDADIEAVARIDRDCAGAFHWCDGWFFRRNDDGSVRVMHRETPTSKWLRADITIPPAEWASIVCGVSAGGETSNRWNDVQDFHGRALAKAA